MTTWPTRYTSAWKTSPYKYSFCLFQNFFSCRAWNRSLLCICMNNCFIFDNKLSDNCLLFSSIPVPKFWNSTLKHAKVIIHNHYSPLTCIVETVLLNNLWISHHYNPVISPLELYTLSRWHTVMKQNENRRQIVVQCEVQPITNLHSNCSLQNGHVNQKCINWM
jgi:hypothetical protein